MTTKPRESRAEFVDKFIERFALGVFLISIAYSIDAIMEIGLEGLPNYFKTLQFGQQFWPLQ